MTSNGAMVVDRLPTFILLDEKHGLVISHHLSHIMGSQDVIKIRSVFIGCQVVPMPCVTLASQALLQTIDMRCCSLLPKGAINSHHQRMCYRKVQLRKERRH